MIFSPLLERRLVINKLPFEYSWSNRRLKEFVAILFSLVVLYCFPQMLIIIMVKSKNSAFGMDRMVVFGFGFVAILLSLFLFIHGILNVSTKYRIKFDSENITWCKEVLFIIVYKWRERLSDYQGLKINEENRSTFNPIIEDASSVPKSVFVVSLIHKTDERKNIVLYETELKSASDTKAKNYAGLFGLKVI